MKRGHIGEEWLPLTLHVEKGGAHDFFSGQSKEIAKGAIDGMDQPAGRNEEEGFTRGVKNGATLALGAFHDGVLVFEGTHGLLDSMLVLPNGISHAINGLTDLV